MFHLWDPLNIIFSTVSKENSFFSRLIHSIRVVFSTQIASAFERRCFNTVERMRIKQIYRSKRKKEKKSERMFWRFSTEFIRECKQFKFIDFTVISRKMSEMWCISRFSIRSEFRVALNVRDLKLGWVKIWAEQAKFVESKIKRQSFVAEWEWILWFSLKIHRRCFWTVRG